MSRAAHDLRLFSYLPTGDIGKSSEAGVSVVSSRKVKKRSVSSRKGGVSVKRPV